MYRFMSFLNEFWWVEPIACAAFLVLPLVSLFCFVSAVLSGLSLEGALYAASTIISFGGWLYVCLWHVLPSFIAGLPFRV